MLFCPTCGNCLLLDPTSQGMAFSCRTCPYVFKISVSVSNKVEFAEKKIDDIFGDDQAWDDKPQTPAECEKCSNPKAYFMEMQIRSADEPATIFYRCTKCGHRWNT